jgi:hypothetical protein
MTAAIFARWHFPMAVPASIRWAQRKDKVLVTAEIIDARSPVLKLDGRNLAFSASAGQTAYANALELYGDVDAARSKYAVRPRGVEIALAKKDGAQWWPRLVKGTGKLYWLSVDWDRWADESDDEARPLDFNWEEASSFGAGAPE